MPVEFSVIVPMWNESNSIGSLIADLLRQTFDDFEVILCDDGSTDGSLDEARRAAKGDVRFKFVSLPHAGVSAARNAGLDHAAGRFVTFADADDGVDPAWLAKLADGLSAFDLFACGYEIRDGEGGMLRDTSTLPKVPRLLDQGEFITALFSNEFLYQGYVWNKGFWRCLIEEAPKPLRFKEGVQYNEDRLFLLEYANRSSSIGISSERLYRYGESIDEFTYRDEQLTEIDAFDDMITLLLIEHPYLHEALFCAIKDRFRAEVILADRAMRDTGAIPERLRRDIREFKPLEVEFEEYPPAFHEAMRRVLRAVG